MVSAMDRLFSEFDLGHCLDNQPQAVRDEVEGFKEDYILTVPEEDLTLALADKAKWDPPVLGEPYVASDEEVTVRRVDDFGRPYARKATRIVVQIPLTGDKTFFRMSARTNQWSPPRAAVNEHYLEVDYVEVGLTADTVRNQVGSLVTAINSYLVQFQEAAEQHNSTIADKVRPFIQARKQRILERRNLVASIGLPIKKRANAPMTYALPDIRRKPRITMPVVKDRAFAPEPAIDKAEYEAILSIMRNMVSVMERSPNAFRTLHEEDIRWHFLFQLNGQYEGRATGETFNYKGDTDILIREDGRNVFIAECKFWSGKEALTKTIDQLVDRYLHWRDNKTAVVIFNRNKDFTNVLEQVEPTITAHPCFKRTVSHSSESEWRFVFRNRDDASREILLSVLVFDVPRVP
jgi:hypothetical protein